MSVEKLSQPMEFTQPRFNDARGYFTETFSVSMLRERSIHETRWVQDNQSYSKERFTLRGLHFQLPPFQQAKLVRVLKGSIFDVLVDLRPNSKDFKTWKAFTLTAQEMNQLYVPAGFAHGFLTLEPDVEVFYKVTNPYSPSHERGLNWADPAVDIKWPISAGTSPILSPKDAAADGFEKLKPELEVLR